MDKKKIILTYILLIIGLTFLTGITVVFYSLMTFKLFDEPVSKEIKRITSPDSLVDAILVEQQGNVTTDNSILIYIVPKGKLYEKGYEQLIADNVYNLDILWKENKYLIIKYENARIFKYSNFWNSDSVNNWNYKVEIRLMPTKEYSLR